MTQERVAVRVQQSLPVYHDAMSDVRQAGPVRQVSVNEGHATRQSVRFQGETFAQLKERLLAAAVPGNNVRLLVNEDWTVLLDDELLPEGDLQIRTMDPGAMRPGYLHPSASLFDSYSSRKGNPTDAASGGQMDKHFQNIPATLASK